MDALDSHLFSWQHHDSCGGRLDFPIVVIDVPSNFRKNQKALGHGFIFINFKRERRFVTVSVNEQRLGFFGTNPGALHTVLVQPVSLS